MVNILLLLIATVSASFYESASSKVENLDASNFKSKVLDSDEIWLVEFYAPWCGHCKNLAPHWDTAARKLKGVVRVGAMNLDEEQNKPTGSQYNIGGFPTIMVFGLNKKKTPEKYGGERTAEGIVKFAANTVQQELMKRLGKGEKKESSGSGSGSGSSGGSSGGSGKDEVVVLDAGNFDRLVYGSKDIWMIEFYAPWCGHCKALEPEWKIAAGKLKGQVKLGKVDADSEKQLAGRFGISGFPTIKVWDYGMGKSDSSARDYQGAREAKDIIAYGGDLADKADIEPDINELSNQKVYDENCQGAVICLVAFLPNIYDSNAVERKAYLQTLKEIAKKQRKSPFEYFWLQAGDQLDLERSLNLGFGFPAIVAVSPQKKMVATMRSSFSKDGINDFCTGLLVGKGGLEKLSAQMKFKKTDKWDGKDAPVIEEEDYGSEYDEL